MDEVVDEGRIGQYALDILEKRAAQKLANGISWTPPTAPKHLLAQLGEGIPPTDWVVPNLLPAGINQFNAQRKTGKTTLALNIMAALVDHKRLFRRFDVNPAPDENVVYLNMELSRAMFLSWARDMGITEDGQQRIHPFHALDEGFGALDLSNERARDWLAEWLIGIRATTLIIDPLAKFYRAERWGGSGDPNVPYNAFWEVLEDVKRNARLRMVLIMHHTGVSEDGADRGRGASAMGDNPTVNFAYRHSGDYNALRPPDNKRYLSGFGRDTDVEEFELGYVDATRTLYVTGGGNRKDAAVVGDARRLWETLMQMCATDKDARPNKGELFEALKWSMSGSGSTKCNAAYNYAVTEQWVTVVPSGTSKLHEPGPKRPDGDDGDMKMPPK